MKIGKFAEKHQVTQDTVRFYIEKGLLVPVKKDTQYYFSDIDSNNMERIKELKELGFSLSEIQRIFSFQRIGGANSDLAIGVLLELLREKRDKVLEELERYKKLNLSLDQWIHKLQEARSKEEKVLGLPLGALSLLQCPCCHEPLSFSNGIIDRNMIIDSHISCNCGYEASVSQGIFVDPKAVRKKLLNGKPMPSKEEFIESADLSFINFIHKAMAKLIECIVKNSGSYKHILELSNCGGFFLLQYIDYLPSDSVYVLIDYDLNRLMQVKRNLEKYHKHKNYLFLCCNVNELPIKKATFDLIVDCFMTRHYYEAHQESLMKLVEQYIMDKGILGGIYSYNALPCKERGQEEELSQGFNREKILQAVTSHNIELLQETEISLEGERTQCQLVLLGKRVAPISKTKHS